MIFYIITNLVGEHRMPVGKLREEFSFLRGNMLTLMVSQIFVDLAGMSATYYGLYILGLGGSPFIIGVIEFATFLAMASSQFLGGYLADKHGESGSLS